MRAPRNPKAMAISPITALAPAAACSVPERPSAGTIQ